MSTAVISPRQLVATVVVAASNSKETWRASWSNTLGRYLQCDGTADDIEIAEALTIGTGGRVVLLDGTYNTAANLSVPANTTLEGQGWGTIINAGGAVITQAVQIIGVQAAIKNMKIQLAAGAGAGGTRPNIVYVNAVDYALLENLWLVGDESVIDDGSATRQVGIQTASATDYLRVLNCRIEDNKRYGIHLQNATTHCIISSNIIRSNFLDGIWVYGSGGTSPVYNIISGNEICDNGATGIMLYTQAPAYSTVVGNNIYNNTSHGIMAYRSSYNTITGNTLITNGGDGIHVEGDAAANSDYNVVADNVCYNNTSNGVEITGGAYSNKNTVSHNELLGNTGGNFVDTGTNTEAYRRYSDLLMDVLAASANHVVIAQALNVATPIVCAIAAQPDAPRNITIAITDGDVSISAFQIDVIGVNTKGQAATEQFLFAGGLAQTGNVAWATITSVTVTTITGAGVGDVLDVGIGIKLGLSNEIYATTDVYKIKKNNANAVVAVAQVNTTYDTYDMVVIGLAATDDFTIWFKSNLNIIG